MTDPEYKVGKNKPPLNTRFQKGQPRPPGAGRKKAQAIRVDDFFDEKVTVPINGRPTKMMSFEVSLINLAGRAIKGDMRAARRFLELCIQAGLLDRHDPSGAPSCYRVNTQVWDGDEWLAQFDKLGPPPWPGRRNGLYNENWRQEATLDD